MLQLFATFTALTWVSWAVFLVFFAIAYGTYSSENYGYSVPSFVISLGLLIFCSKYLWVDFSTQGFILKAFGAFGKYVLIGVLVSFVNWIIYCRGVKFRVQEYVTIDDNVKQKLSGMRGQLYMLLEDIAVEDEFPRIPASVSDTLVMQALHVTKLKSNYSLIFGNAYSKIATLRFDGSTSIGFLNKLDVVEMEQKVTEILADAFPPKAKYAKTILVVPIFEWPVTVVHLVLHRLLNWVGEELVRMGTKLYDLASRLAFGSY